MDREKIKLIFGEDNWGNVFDPRDRGVSWSKWFALTVGSFVGLSWVVILLLIYIGF